MHPCSEAFLLIFLRRGAARARGGGWCRGQNIAGGGLRASEVPAHGASGLVVA